MDYQRIAATSGLISAALLLVFIVTFFAGGAPPALDDPAQKVLNYYQDNRSLSYITAAIGFILLGLIPIFFLGVYALLRDALAPNLQVWPRLSLVALIVTGAFVGVQGSAAFALALGAKDEFGGSPPVAGALFDLYNALAAAIAVVFAVFLLAVGVAQDRAAGYPKWWSQMLYIGAAASLISFLAPFTNSDFLAILGLLPVILFAVWIAVASLAMQRGTRGTAPLSREPLGRN
jgi:hypothetical protein